MTAEGVWLIPAETVQVFGNYDPASWQYVLTLTRPSHSRTVRVPGSSVVHLR